MCFSSLVECWLNPLLKTTSNVDNHPWPCRQVHSTTTRTTEKKWMHGSEVILLIIGNNKGSLVKFNNKGMMRNGMSFGDIALNYLQILRAYIRKENSVKVAIVLMYCKILRTCTAHTVPNIWFKKKWCLYTNLKCILAWPSLQRLWLWN